MKTLWESRQYTQIITLAQYLTSLTAQQDAWIEAGKSLINFFNVDVCAFGVRRADGTIIVRHWISAESCFTNVLSPDVTLSGLINPLLGDTELDIHELIEETLESGFLTTQLFLTPVPLSLAFLPITHENQVIAVMLIGHHLPEPIPNELLNVYLAVAGLVGTTATRLASEQELRQHRQHLAELVEERTLALTSVNQQLQQEIIERTRTEAILAARLRLITFARTSTLQSLMQATLDEAESLTGSRIGFFHFLQPDQNTLLLQSWSTNTVQNMSRDEAANRYYTMDQAEVWAECIRTRSAIIHNDYAAIPYRRDPPSGRVQLLREIVVPVLRGSQIVAVLGVGNKSADYTSEDVKIITSLADFAWDIVENKRAEEALQQQATTDELTGVTNRRHFLAMASHELKRMARLQHPLSIALIDLDHFKQINDTHGHVGGDQALRIFTRICQQHIRAIDLLARFGGDEFVLLLPTTTSKQAHDVVERVRLALTVQAVEITNGPVSMTISVGIATCHVGEPQSLDMLLERADLALYRAKKAGRNRIDVDDTPLDQ
ncbi:MAG: diguanylate cyclase [Chloroflexales bacterium]|jgi:diguanylate cyclase (GGDEF)-like protein